MLSLMALPVRNLRAYPARTGALVVFAALMAMATFGGTVLIQGIRQGLETVEARLGADVLVTPSEADNEFNPQTFLLEAEPNYFYMDIGNVAEVGAIDGVKAVSPQLFLASARASCCSGRYQVIAFDPATDFVIQPWIADTTGNPVIGEMDVIIGSNVSAPVNDRFQIYGKTLHVVGQFDPTGSTLDNAVYADFDTGRVLMEASVEKGLNKYHDFDPDGVISSVMVDVEPGTDIEAVAAQIRENVDGVSVATAKSMVKGIATTLDDTSRTIAVFVVIVWAIGVGMSVLVFTVMIHERAREFALLKAMGVSRSQLGRLVVREAVTVDVVGALVGIAISGILLAAFQTLVGQFLGIGFLLPSPVVLGLLALGSLVAVLVAAGVASWISVRRINGMDAGCVLKEGE